MDTAKKLGFAKGDFVLTGMDWPAIIVADAHTATPCCEVWGFEHESGSVYAEELSKLTFEQFEARAKQFGYDGTAYGEVAKQAIKQAQTLVAHVANAR